MGIQGYISGGGHKERLREGSGGAQVASVQRGWAGCTGGGNLHQIFVSFLAISPTEYLGKPAGKFTNGVHVMDTGTNFKSKSVVKKPAYNHDCKDTGTTNIQRTTICSVSYVFQKFMFSCVL